MKTGYARVSTDDQNADLQYRALRRAGCEKIFHDIGKSGSRDDRPGLKKALRSLKPGDVLAVWKLDRLGRSLPNLIETLTLLRSREVEFQSLQEQIDTTSAGGRFYLHILAALAEFEREMIRERTKAGIEAARQRGVVFGRPHKLSANQLRDARKLLASGMSRKAVADVLGVSIATLRRRVETVQEAKAASTPATD